MSFKMFRAIGSLLGKKNRHKKAKKKVEEPKVTVTSGTPKELTEGTRRSAQIPAGALEELKYQDAKSFWKAEIRPYVSTDRRWENIGVRMQLDAEQKFREWQAKQLTS